LGFLPRQKVFWAGQWKKPVVAGTNPGKNLYFKAVVDYIILIL